MAMTHDKWSNIHMTVIMRGMMPGCTGEQIPHVYTVTKRSTSRKGGTHLDQVRGNVHRFFHSSPGENRPICHPWLMRMGYPCSQVGLEGRELQRDGLPPSGCTGEPLLRRAAHSSPGEL